MNTCRPTAGRRAAATASLDHGSARQTLLEEPARHKLLASSALTKPLVKYLRDRPTIRAQTKSSLTLTVKRSSRAMSLMTGKRLASHSEQVGELGPPNDVKATSLILTALQKPRSLDALAFLGATLYAMFDVNQ